jgi:phage/plasmid-associated DNA primase
MVTTVYKKEADKVMDFIDETKDGKYTDGKPDLTHITYTRMEIQEGDSTNIFNDYFEDAVLYGISY